MNFVLDLQGMANDGLALSPESPSTLSPFFCLSNWSLFVCFAPTEG